MEKTTTLHTLILRILYRLGSGALNQTQTVRNHTLRCTVTLSCESGDLRNVKCVSGAIRSLHHGKPKVTTFRVY